MASKGTVAIKFVGDVGDLSKSIGEADSKLAGFGKAAAVGMAALAAGVAGAAVGLFKLGGSFDEQYDKIRVGTGATGDALDDLQGSFKNVLKNVPTDFASAGTAIADLNTRLGLTGKPLEDLSGQFINLARITGTDVTQSIDNITRLFGDWGTSTEDQASTMDKLYRAAQSSGIGIDDLSTSLVQFGAPLRNLGFGIDESMALLAQFNKTGVNTETVFAGMKAGVGKLAKAGEDVPATFKRIVDEITKMGPGTEATALAIELFGQRAGPDLADAIAGGKFELDGMLAAITGGKDTINGAAADTADFSEKWLMFKNRVLVGLEPLATGVFNALGTAMDTLGPIAERLFGAFNQLFNIIFRGDFVGGPFAEDSPFVDTVFNLRDQYLPIIQNAWAAIQSAIQTVTGFVTGILDKFRGDHDNAASGVGQASSKITGILGQLQATFGSIFAAVQAIVQTFVAVVTDLWNRFGTHLLAFAKATFDNLLQVISGLLQAIHGVFEVFAGIFTGDWQRVWNGVKAIFGGVWDAVLGIVKQAINMIGTTIGAGMAFISAAVAQGLDGILGFFRSLPGRIGAALGNLGGLLYDKGRALIGGLVRGIRSAGSAVLDAIKDLIPGGGILGKAADILGFNTGGVVPGPRGASRLAVVHGGETILPTHKAGFVAAAAPVDIGPLIDELRALRAEVRKQTNTEVRVARYG